MQKTWKKNNSMPNESWKLHDLLILCKLFKLIILCKLFKLIIMLLEQKYNINWAHWHLQTIYQINYSFVPNAYTREFIKSTRWIFFIYFLSYFG